MDLRFYDSQGFKQEVDLDLDKLIECLIKEKKYLKAGRGMGINNILSKCILMASAKHTIYSTKLPDIFRIEIYKPF
jgi:hypothetical protein